jgi:hypothetical protein
MSKLLTKITLMQDLLIGLAIVYIIVSSLAHNTVTGECSTKLPAALLKCAMHLVAMFVLYLLSVELQHP